MFARELLMLALTSLVLVAFSAFSFRLKPATRRLFLLLATGIFLLTPLLTRILAFSWTVGVADLSNWIVQMELPMTPVIVLAGVGAALVLRRLLTVYRDLCSIRRLPAVLSPTIHLLIKRYGGELGDRGRIEVRSGRDPCSTSIGAATIVLPHSWRQWSSATLEAVIIHELTHLARRDSRWTLLIQLVALAFWWLPWLRMLPWLFERAVEESCDDLAAAILNSEVVYLDGVYQVASESAATDTWIETRSDQPANALTGASIVRRFQRFSEFRDQQTDSRGLYWLSLLLSIGYSAMWGVEFAQLPIRMDGNQRIVATTMDSALPDRIELRLREKPREPLDSVVDPPIR